MRSLLGKSWRQRGSFDPQKSLFENFCVTRDITEQDIMPVQFEDIADPFVFKDMHRAIDRIIQAIENSEKICIFGDYDADGITGTALLFLTLRHLHAQVSYILPSRADGYGFSQKFADQVIAEGHNLLITNDCGISNTDTISFIKGSGIDTILTDHHLPPDNIPSAYAILHPLLPEETFTDKDITGAGVAFFLSLALLQKKLGKKKSKKIVEQLLELASIGTIADCGAMKGQNKILVLLGLRALEKTTNKGLLRIMELSGINTKDITHEDIAFYLAPRLNAAGRMDHPDKALELILGKVTNASLLELLNQKRQKIVSEFLTQAETMRTKHKNLPALILKSPNWPSGIIGLLAGKLQEKYYQPTIIMEQKQEGLTASCRGPSNFHFLKALKSIHHSEKNIFLGFGGHAAAAGFSLAVENLEIFKKLFYDEVEKQLGKNPPPPEVLFDGNVENMITQNDLHDLKKAQPFGNKNPAPTFCFPKSEIKKIRCVGNENKHLSLWVQTASGQCISGIFFGQSENYDQIKAQGLWDIIATPEINMWQGKERLQLKIADIRLYTQ